MKVLAALVASALPVMSAYAQMQLPNPSSPTDAVPINAPKNVGSGNQYEKEVTPLLRDISKKKSLLELRKLDRELEKLEEEALTAQIERDKALNPPAINVNPNSPNFGNAMPSVQSTPVPTVTASGSEEDNVRVLMVYGNDNDLYAKVSSGSQGGYVVRKGDILPDGRMVTNITPNFVEVKKASKAKSKGLDKLYVLGPLPAKAGGSVSSTGSTPGTSMIPTPTVQNGASTGGIPPGAVIIPNMGPRSLPAVPVNAAPIR